jgi:DNA-binding MurR/RpiR family transcriptional regulator
MVPSLLGRLPGLVPELPDGRRRIAELILADPPAAAAATISELAARTGTSPATVNRFCHALGLNGYADLRLAIATDAGRAQQATWMLDVGGEIGPDDPLDRLVQSVAAADTRAIQQTAERIDLQVLDAVAEAVAAARRVEMFGIGGSAVAGDELRFRLHRIGIAAWAWREVQEALTSVALLDERDVLVAVSYSGRVQETIEVVRAAAERGVTTAVVTNFPHSPLARLADLVLITAVQETTFRSAALAARHSQLFVVDIVYAAVAQRMYDRAIEAYGVTGAAVAGHLVADRPARVRRTRKAATK